MCVKKKTTVSLRNYFNLCVYRVLTAAASSVSFGLHTIVSLCFCFDSCFLTEERRVRRSAIIVMQVLRLLADFEEATRAYT